MNENTKSYTDLAVEVNKEFNNGLLNSEKIKKKLKKLKSKDANFKDVYEVSDEVSDKMKKAFREKITKDILPDGKMQKDIADSVIKANLKDGHKIISGYAADTQGLINKKQGINIKGIQAEFNEERCDNLINKLCDYDDYDKGKWLLDEPIKNFYDSSVDDAIEANADFLSKSGFKETISRSTNGGCCEWCEEVSGTFDYEYVKEWVRRDPKHNVFSRHRYCNCIISHNTEKGRKAVNNQWNENKHKKERRRKLEADFYATDDNRVFKREHRKYIGKSKYETLIKQYTNEESRKFIRTAYRKSSVVGDGGTYDIRKMELETGLNLGRNNRSHAKKVEDLKRQLNKSLKKDLPQKDREYLEKELEKLKELK